MNVVIAFCDGDALFYWLGDDDLLFSADCDPHGPSTLSDSIGIPSSSAGNILAIVKGFL